MGKGKVNILFLSHHAELGGGEIDLLEFLKAMDRNRFDPIVFVGCKGPLKERSVALGVRTETLCLPEYFITLKRDPLRKNSLFSLLKITLVFIQLVKKIERIITEHNIDIVYANTAKSACLGIPAAEKTGTESIWRLHDCLTNEFYGKFYLWFIKRMTRPVNSVICVSEMVKEEYLKFAGKNDAQKAEVVSNGVDLQEFRPDRQNETLKKSLAKKEECIITLIGRLEPWKGQEIFIRAAGLALEKNPNLKFLIIGGALFGRKEYEDKLKVLIEGLGLQGKVVLLGFRSDISEIMAISNIIVHTSYLPEPFGRDVMEAMACGKPVISTDIGGPKEILTPDTGILIEPKRPDILADEIIKLINDPARIELLGKNARRRAEELFDIKKITKKIEEILLSL